MIEQHHLAPGLARLLALAAGAGMGALWLVFILLQRHSLCRK
ncbi:MAG TPA: hypothetical protein VKC51_07780 [Lacunisphaera sp.]|nr:hypothetical protein [Lacunisphaera sp.]